MLPAVPDVDDPSPSPPPVPENPAASSFYAGALPRISQFMLALAAVGSAAAWAFVGWRIAAGFVCGCAIAYLNFHWLKKGVSGLADRITESGERRSSSGIVLRFVFRYLLMAIAAYLIFRFLPASLGGLFAGLFLPVAAILFEACYEAYVAIVRGL